MDQFEVLQTDQGGLVKSWTRGVDFDENAKKQLLNTARLPFIHKWVAAMPDVHVGIGATVGSVIPTHKAIIPAAVGVDIGCGMMAVQTNLKSDVLPDNLKPIRDVIEKSVPHGRTNRGRSEDKGSWKVIPNLVNKNWKNLEPGYQRLIQKFPKLSKGNSIRHLGTLGGGNHFIEVCIDKKEQIWFMLHSGSRGIGNLIGRYFIELARKDMSKWQINLPNSDLSYFPEGTDHFQDYVIAVSWAQDFARLNRQIMMDNLLAAIRRSTLLPPFQMKDKAVNCHHNYVEKEHHYGENVWVTRKGAVRAREGDLGIIPGSMGARSYIVRGKGNPQSFHSCSHGAGRVLSRTEAKKKYTIDDHIQATKGIECRKDAQVIDETPMAYKPIDKVMEAQKDLVEVVHELKQVICVKG